MKSVIKCFLLIVVCFVYFTISVQAETMYVSDNLSVTVRTGQGATHKIIALIKSGQRVEVLEKGDQWTLARLQNGKEGWVLTRYLINDIPKGIQLAALQTKYANVAAQAESLKEENNRLKSDNKKLSVTLAESQKAYHSLQGDHETLKADSAGFLEMKSNYEKASIQLSKETKKAKELEKQVEKLQLYQYIKRFLAGSCVLLGGFICGFSSNRQRRQSSLY
jgi:SH3 domain protein